MAVVKALTQEEKAEALSEAFGCCFEEAQAVLEELEFNGFTVYHKKRRINARRAAVAEAMTPQLRQQIRQLYRTSGLTQQQIAARLNVNIGRVCEALAR